MEDSDFLDNKLDDYADIISERTLGPLRRAGIETVRDLVTLSDDELWGVKGFGEKCYEEIKMIDFANTTPTKAHKNEVVSMPLQDWIHSALNERQAVILEQLYGLIDGKTRTLDEVGELFGITRERVRQIKQRALEKLEVALENGRIDGRMLVKFDRLAKENVRLSDVNNLSNVYNNAMVAALLSDVLKRNQVVKDKRLKSSWLVDDDKKLLEYLDTILDWLQSQIGLVDIDELARQSGVPLKIIEDLASIRREGNNIALVNGYRKDGIDRMNLVLSVMRENISPMKIDEISEKTGLGIDVLRGYLYRIPGLVNVGNSVFALEEFGYSSKDTKELIIEYLTECGEPRHMSDIVKYVLHRREVDKTAVTSAIYAGTDIFTRFQNGYVALAEWGYESDAQKKIIYEIPVREALIAAFRNNPERALTNRDLANILLRDFKGKTSSSYGTISMETKRMADEGLLEVLGVGIKYYRLAE